MSAIEFKAHAGRPFDQEKVDEAELAALVAKIDKNDEALQHFFDLRDDYDRRCVKPTPTSTAPRRRKRLRPRRGT